MNNPIVFPYIILRVDLSGGVAQSFTFSDGSIIYISNKLRQSFDEILVHNLSNQDVFVSFNFVANSIDVQGIKTIPTQTAIKFQSNEFSYISLYSDDDAVVELICTRG